MDDTHVGWRYLSSGDYPWWTVHAVKCVRRFHTLEAAYVKARDVHSCSMTAGYMQYVAWLLVHDDTERWADYMRPDSDTIYAILHLHSLILPCFG